MARIRTIKPEFWTSETIARLDLLDRLLFIGLWNYADDDGRAKDNAALVKAAVFPLDESVSLPRIHEGLQSLESAGLVVRYQVDGKRFLALPTWQEHQKVSHPAPSKFPAPDQAQEDDRNPPEPLANPPESLAPEQGKEQGTGNRESTSSPSAPSGEVPDPDFDRFWEQYPRKVVRKEALKAWRSVTKSNHADDIIIGLDPWCAYWRRQRTAQEHIPHASTWLRQERWLEQPHSGPPARQAHVSHAGALMAPGVEF